MTNLTDTEIHQLLDKLDTLFDKDPDIAFIHLEENDEGEDFILIGHLNAKEAYLPGKFDFEKAETNRELQIKVVQSEPIELDKAPPEIKSTAYTYLPTDAGLSGIQIKDENGFWGTSTITVHKIEVELYKGSRLIKRCKRKGPTLISNSHVMEKSGMVMSFLDNPIGKCKCLFDLDKNPSLDYAHADWTHQIIDENYWHLFMETSSNRKEKIEDIALTKRKQKVFKQGARTGFTSGRVGKPATIRLKGHRGKFRCRKANYKSNQGDSGSAVLIKKKGKWYWVGIHFASGPYFLTWDEINAINNTENEFQHQMIIKTEE